MAYCPIFNADNGPRFETYEPFYCKFRNIILLEYVWTYKSNTSKYEW